MDNRTYNKNSYQASKKEVSKFVLVAFYLPIKFILIYIVKEANIKPEENSCEVLHVIAALIPLNWSDKGIETEYQAIGECMCALESVNLWI